MVTSDGGLLVKSKVMHNIILYYLFIVFMYIFINILLSSKYALRPIDTTYAL